MRSLGCKEKGAGAAPLTLLDGVEADVCELLQIASPRHRSALLEIGQRDHLPDGLVETVFARIDANWRACGADEGVVRSQQNWRWRRPVLAIGADNTSPEVRLERALIAACEAAGRDDWSNQVPVASGLTGGGRERRRAVDLVHRAAPSWFELVELKVASDTPLYAALEITAYACIWLLARRKLHVEASEILQAQRLDAVVLAPEAYYARFRLEGLQKALQRGLRDLGALHGVTMSFDFQSFPAGAMERRDEVTALVGLLDQRSRLTPCA